MKSITYINESNLAQKYFFRLKYGIRTFLGDYPELFFPANSWTKGKKWAVNESTELVIEGFQRSGNTFSVGAFNNSQPQKVSVASHLHIPAQVIYAARKNIPTLVIIRHPLDAVLSWKALELESSLKLNHVPLDYSFNQLFRYYIRFYTKILPYQDKFVVASFEEITTDFGAVVGKINCYFDTKFALFEHTQENVKKVLDFQNFHAGTSLTRQELKNTVIHKYETKLKSANFRSLVSKAENIYEQFKQLA
jgi:hypothetical protein